MSSSPIWTLPGREKMSLAAARKINSTGVRHGPRNG